MPTVIISVCMALALGAAPTLYAQEQAEPAATEAEQTESAATEQEQAEPAATEAERILPVPETLRGFQIGTLVGINADFGKGFGDWQDFYSDITAFLDYYYDFFSVATSFGLTDQDRFDLERGLSPIDFYIGHWFQLHEGTFGFHFDQFSLLLGLSPHRDAIASPYSLFISSRDLPALQADFSYDGDTFFITNRWVGLSVNSSVPLDPQEESSPTLKDRGLNFRTFGIKFEGGWRLGYQESIVYIDNYFDPLYFLVPIPYQFTQLVASTVGSPYSTAPDPNTLLGFFLEYDSSPHFAYLQVLIDDFQFLAAGKLAWSVGYRVDTEAGRFGFYHAGATKFTYQGTRPSTNYPYAYHATYAYNTRAGLKTVWYFDNYIGYLYGENTISFRMEYENRFGPLRLIGGLEYVASGDKSPTNPWHAASGPPGETLLLDSERLEHTISLDIATETDVYEDIDFLLDVSIGYVFNELALTDAGLEDDNSRQQIFTPSDTNRLLFYLFVGVQYVFNQHDAPWRQRRNVAQKRY